jgi:hypothetical protein
MSHITHHFPSHLPLSLWQIYHWIFIRSICGSYKFNGGFTHLLYGDIWKMRWRVFYLLYGDIWKMRWRIFFFLFFYHFSSRMSHVTRNSPSHLSSIPFVNLPLDLWYPYVSSTNSKVDLHIYYIWVKDEMENFFFIPSLIHPICKSIIYFMRPTYRSHKFNGRFDHPLYGDGWKLRWRMVFIISQIEWVM